MSITTLKETTWIFNDTIDLQEFSYDIDFRCGSSPALCVRIYTTSSGLMLRRSNSATITMYSASTGAWESFWGCQSVYFYGGDDEENGDLISWMQANARQVENVYKVMPYELFSTAEAIRAKSGGTSTIEWAQYSGFSSAVKGIYVGTDTRDATATAYDILSGETAYVNAKKIVGTITNAEGVMF